MSIFSRAIQAFRRPVQSGHTEGTSARIDPLVPPSVFSEAGEGNQYHVYSTAVEEIVKKYNNESAFGCQVTRHVLEWRASTIAGNGLNATAEDESANEALQNFVKYNALDSYGLFENVLEGEMEGKSLFKLVLEEDEETGEPTVCLKHYSWCQHRYHIHTAADDYEYIERIEFPATSTNIEGDALKDWIYVKLGGSRRYVNLTPPRIANVLYHIENLDKALADLRRNNYLFGAPTPFIAAPNENEAKILRRSIFGAAKEFVWKIGKMLIASGSMTYVEPSGRAIESITKEVETLAKIISASTGIPVHFLGYVDLMSNRATATELMEMVNATTSHEREIWKGKMEQACVRALELLGYSGPEVEVSIPVVTMAQVELVANVYGNLYNLGAISLKTLMRMVPGIDPEKELEAIEEEKKSRMERAMDLVGRTMPKGGPDESDNSMRDAVQDS